MLSFIFRLFYRLPESSCSFPQVTPGIGGHLRHLIHKTRGMPGALLAHMLACRPHGEGRYGHMHAGVRYLQL